MMRIFFGAAAALTVAFLCIYLIQAIGHSFVPLPAGIEPGNMVGEPVAADATPVAANAVLLIGWFVGVLLGGWAGNRIARIALPGWILACLIIGAGIANLFGNPHPSWLWAGAVVLPLIGAWLAQRLARVPLLP